MIFAQWCELLLTAVTVREVTLVVNRRVAQLLGQPIFAQRSTDNAYYRILWADMTREVQNSWGRPGDPDPQTRGVNHLNRGGDAPEGSTEAYLNGHARWVPFVRFRARPKLRLDSTVGVFEHYFHGGRDDAAIR